MTHDRNAPISDHTDVTWAQLQELVDRMVADGRIPRTGTHAVRVVTPTTMDPITDCPVCGDDAEHASAPGPNEPIDEYDCPHCGHQFRRSP